MYLFHLSECMLDTVDGNSSAMTSDVQLPGWVSGEASARVPSRSGSVVFAPSWLHPPPPHAARGHTLLPSPRCGVGTGVWRESLCVRSLGESITAHMAGPQGDGAWVASFWSD